MSRRSITSNGTSAFFPLPAVPSFLFSPPLALSFPPSLLLSLDLDLEGLDLSRFDSRCFAGEVDVRMSSFAMGTGPLVDLLGEFTTGRIVCSREEAVSAGSGEREGASAEVGSYPIPRGGGHDGRGRGRGRLTTTSLSASRMEELMLDWLTLRELARYRERGSDGGSLKGDESERGGNRRGERAVGRAGRWEGAGRRERQYCGSSARGRCALGRRRSVCRKRGRALSLSAAGGPSGSARRWHRAGRARLTVHGGGSVGTRRSGA